MVNVTRVVRKNLAGSVKTLLPYKIKFVAIAMGSIVARRMVKSLLVYFGMEGMAGMASTK